MGFFDYFGTVILVSLFWSLAFTLQIYSLPTEELNQLIVVDFSAKNDNLGTGYAETAREVQSNIEAQNKVGLVDLAALALYSGNLMLDLATNFFFAIPSMFTMLFAGIFRLFQIDAFLQSDLLAWVQVVFSVIAAVALIRFLLGSRTQSLAAV